MKKIITDFDGVVVESELAKGFGWYLGYSYLNNDSEIKLELLKELELNPNKAKPKLDEIAASRRNDLLVARSCGGGTTFDFAKKIWQKFCANEDREPNEEELRFINEQLIPVRGRIKEQIVNLYSLPIDSNLRFFKALYEEMQFTENHPLGIVTLSPTKILKNQFDNTINGKTVWTAFPEFPKLFGNYSANGFPYIECGGDLGLNYDGISKDEIKVQSYKLICKKLNISPGETISFEDTSKGIESAKKAGVLCCGIKDEISLQDLSNADIVVHGSLENIIEIAPLIAKSEPKKAIEIIGNYLVSKGAKK